MAARLPRRPCAALAALALVAVMTGCGDDEPAGTGDEVEGRVPTTEVDGDDEDDATTTAPPTATTAGEGEGATTAPGPLGDVAVTLTEVASLSAPTKLVARPDSEVLYVAEQGGRVVTLVPDGDALVEAGVALDLTDVTRSGGEQGLLGLAFSPDGATLFVHHSGTGGETRVASFTMDGDEADDASRVDLLEVDQPFPNHNGGEIVVDDDGLLWIGLGDGGSGGDPDDRAQDPQDLLGKVLRIDPDGADGDLPYGIPADNPFADGSQGRPEVVVTGVRNPWRLRLDAETGDLWLADVGQNEIEEIDHLPAAEILGANLGWSRFEGSATYDESREVREGPAVGPVFEMVHSDGWCSVTGGPVYRGEAIPDLRGAYLFGDYCKAGLSALRLDGSTVTETAVLDGEAGQVVSIDTDGAGELYVLSQEGPIWRVDPPAG